MRLRLFAALILALALGPSPAAASFHEVSIREVFPGDSAQPEAQYVELQAYASGQNLIAEHTVTFHNAAGANIGTEPFNADVSDGRNQMTFVIATPSAESRFGIVADEGMPAKPLDPAGGAVCWESLDCVSWGAFAGTTLPSPAGSPAAPGGVPDGMALRRTIAPGCPTLLEASDDHDNSALDFSTVFPSPRPNSVAPSERPCGGSGPSTGANKGGAPETRIKKRPKARTRDRTPTFRFAADESDVTFQCKLDRKRFRTCRSPFTAPRLSFGRHSFAVRARDADGQLDPTPATDAFKVLRARP